MDEKTWVSNATQIGLRIEEIREILSHESGLGLSNSAGKFLLSVISTQEARMRDAWGQAKNALFSFNQATMDGSSYRNGVRKLEDLEKFLKQSLGGGKIMSETIFERMERLKAELALEKEKVKHFDNLLNEKESETAALRRERDELTAKLDEANGVLTRAGYTLADGASAWKPPVNKENGALWQRVFDAESKLQAAEKELSRLNELEKKFAPVAIECELLEDDKKRLEASLAHRTAALESIKEYWNRDQNETAMADACWHNIETAEKALSDSPSAATEGKSDKPEAAGEAKEEYCPFPGCHWCNSKYDKSPAEGE